MNSGLALADTITLGGRNRTGTELILATKPFTVDDPVKLVVPSFYDRALAGSDRWHAVDSLSCG